MVKLTDLLARAWLVPLAYGASQSRLSTTTSSQPQFTIPASADVGAQLIANIDDPQAVDAQLACPGYKASNVQLSPRGFSASLQLAGKPCNVYGTDVDSLALSVEYQDSDRLNIQILPTHIDASNASWYLLSETLVPRPKASSNASVSQSDFLLSWSNEPSFNFKVVRKATGDVLFDTEGTVLVYEDQFIEFVTALPDEYNLYGLGEHITQLRLHRNSNLTIYASDDGTPLDR